MILQLDSLPCHRKVFASEAEWVDGRKSFIGASEVASVFGVGYAATSPLTVWWSKRGNEPPAFDDATRKRMALGKKMEPIISDLFTDETGLPCHDPGDFAVFYHREIPWHATTLDRLAVHDDYGPVPVELKHINGRFRGDWDAEDEPPLKYMVQCQAQISVTGASHCYLVGLIGGDELSVRLVERNQKFIDAMLVRLADFWKHVQDGSMPPIDESEATKAMLATIYPRDTGLTVSLPGDATDWDRELIEVKEQIKTLETRRNYLENQIKAAIGDAAIGLLPCGGSYSWRTQQRAEYVVKATEFRVLRRSSK